MRKLTVWMEYTGHSEIEVEVPDDFAVPSRLEEWPNEWLRNLDDSLVENSPSDWGYREQR